MHGKQKRRPKARRREIKTSPIDGTRALARTADLSRAGDLASALWRRGAICATDEDGPVLNQILARTYDLFDEIDEILLALNPAKDHDAFAMVAALHRRFEEIQSLIPRARRWK